MKIKNLGIIGIILLLWLGFIFFDGFISIAKEDSDREGSEAINVQNFVNKEDRQVIKLEDENAKLQAEKKSLEEERKLEEQKKLEEEKLTQEDSKIPVRFNITGIDFYPQAPYSDWSAPYQEACEEASLLLGYNYIIGRKQNRKEFRNELLDIIKWENEYFGYYEDTYVEQVQEILRKLYKYDNSIVINNPSVEDMKNQIAKGNVIVAPFYGKSLGNPQYNNGGADYHMMLIKGYDEENFIVHDVGTIKGKDRHYSYDTIMNSLHDRHPEDIQKGAKNVLVIKKGNGSIGDKFGYIG